MAQFARGQSGNPSGARPGARYGRSTLEKALRQHVAPVLPELIERTVEAALKGDVHAAGVLVNTYSTAVTAPATKTTSGA